MVDLWERYEGWGKDVPRAGNRVSGFREQGQALRATYSSQDRLEWN